MKKNLDISFIPEQFVFFWWLSRIINNYDNLIISKEQIYIFGTPTWDLYRDHYIMIKDGDKLEYINTYIKRKIKQ